MEQPGNVFWKNRGGLAPDPVGSTELIIGSEVEITHHLNDAGVGRRGRKRPIGRPSSMDYVDHGPKRGSTHVSRFPKGLEVHDTRVSARVRLASGSRLNSSVIRALGGALGEALGEALRSLVENRKKVVPKC